MGIVQKPTARPYFSKEEEKKKKPVISTPGFPDVISTGWITFTTVQN
jgi:hypothetical protein